MNSKIVVYTSNNSENELLISRAYDVNEASYTRRKNCYFGFLNEAEIYTLNESLHIDSSQFCFWGG